MPRKRVKGLPPWAQPHGVQHDEVNYGLDAEDEVQQADTTTDESLDTENPAD